MPRPWRRESEETARVPALSDGVIAISITLMVLDISVPDVPENSTASVLPKLVVEQWQQYAAFALSFLVIGLYWVLHRRIFVYLDRHDRGVVWLNLLFLLLVALVPFATSLVTSYPSRFGVMLYSGILALTGFSLAGLWIHASWRKLVDEGLTSRTTQIQAARFLASPVVLVIAMAVAASSAVVGMLTWLLLVPINAVLQSRLLESLEEAAPPSK